jgi:DNA transformation protein
MLAAAGIRTVAELRAVGAVAAYRRVRFARSGQASLVLLYALEGALTGVRWDRLPTATRERLRREAEATPD